MAAPLTELEREANRLFSQFRDGDKRRLYSDIIRDPTSPFREEPDHSDAGTAFAILMLYRREYSMSDIATIVGRNAVWTNAEKNTFLQFVIARMRLFDDLFIARNLRAGEEAGLEGFRDEGKAAPHSPDTPAQIAARAAANAADAAAAPPGTHPIIRTGIKYNDLPYGVAKRIADLLKKPADVGRTTKQSLAAIRAQFPERGGRRRRRARTVKKRRT